MAELLLELFSEEIPARMQARAGADLARLLTEALAPLSPADIRGFWGPRRIAVAVTVAAGVAASSISERGPRCSAPEQALAGFLRKHGAGKDDLRQDGDFWVLEKTVPGQDAAALIAATLPGLLRRFPWPKSMRWGGTSAFTWVRPLRRILCILDGAVVPFDLRDGADDGHGLESANITEGHRFLSPGPFSVASLAEWRDGLRARHVIVDAAERQRLIAEGLASLAAGHGLTLVEDAGLLDEVAGLVEWPVPLLGAIDAAYMDLPAEVMQVSMRVNQRYFALRDGQGAAPWFAFVANIAATDGGGAIIAGNERVLRARFSDARHFWDLDRKQRLDSRVAALDGITFHGRLGSQGARVARIGALAGHLAPALGAVSAQARRAALLAKADLTTGMVGEFPELQGVMGGYYARHDGEDGEVAQAVAEHYQPKGPTDPVPESATGAAVALADKLDTLAGFFAIDERPTGSGDPFALRRAALGVIRIIRDRGLRLPLRQMIDQALAAFPTVADDAADALFAFLIERLRVQLRAEGARHDVLTAVLGAGADDDLVRLLARGDAVAGLLGTEDGANLLAAYRRAANILRIEDKKDGPHTGPVDPALLVAADECALHDAILAVEPAVIDRVVGENFTAAMAVLAGLRAPLDAFFTNVTVNDSLPELRRNRLALLARVRAAMNQTADFSRIEG